jgi:hypothetical protein
MEAQVSRGFLIYAQNTSDVDYVRQAYALALSIRNTQTVTNVSLVTDDELPKKYQDVFDQIIPIPFGDTAAPSLYCAEDRWKLYHASPYHETIVLDTDMLMLEDIGSWWDYCSNHDIKYTSRIRNYKMEIVNDTIHRKTFIANQLTSPYSALHYFKKSQTAYEFYRVLEFVCNNWEWCWDKFAPNKYQNWLSMDLAVAVAIEITGLHEQILDSVGPLEFVHMKTHLQNWRVDSTTWQDFVLSNFTNNTLSVSNIPQHKIFHYVEKDFLTEDIVNKLEELHLA